MTYLVCNFGTFNLFFLRRPHHRYEGQKAQHSNNNVHYYALRNVLGSEARKQSFLAKEFVAALRGDEDSDRVAHATTHRPKAGPFALPPSEPTATGRLQERHSVERSDWLIEVCARVHQPHRSWMFAAAGLLLHVYVAPAEIKVY